MRAAKQRYGKKGATKSSNKWYVYLKNVAGEQKSVPGFPDKKLTEEFGRKLERLVHVGQVGHLPDEELVRFLDKLDLSQVDRLVEKGIIDPQFVVRRTCLIDQLDQFRNALLKKEDSKAHVDLTHTRIRKLVTGCGFTVLADVKYTVVDDYLAKRRNGPEKLSRHTSNLYVKAFKQFCNWILRDTPNVISPAKQLSLMNADCDRRRERRAMTGEEVRRLIEVTWGGAKHHKLDGQSRAMLYWLAVETGLRRGELSALKGKSCDLGEDPSVTVEAKHTKNRKKTVQPIRPEFADALQTWFLERGLGPDDELWPQLTRRTAEMLQKDLLAVEIPYVDEHGSYADFHAFRHSYISFLSNGGVLPHIVQQLARHSTVELTLGTYTHTSRTVTRSALDSLPIISSPTASSPRCLPSHLPETSAEERQGVLFGATGMPVLEDPERAGQRSLGGLESLEKPGSSAYSPTGRSGPGEVAEWPNAPVLKTGVVSKRPGVRIPPSPLF